MRSPISEMVRTESGTAAAVIDDVMSKGPSQPALIRPPRTQVRQESPDDSPQSSSVDEVLDESFPASDPPSWTGAISRVAAPANVSERLVRQIRAEYLEMPGLCLSIQQAQRLWALEPRVCAALLKSLIDARFLRRNERGLFLLSTSRG